MGRQEHLPFSRSENASRLLAARFAFVGARLAQASRGFAPLLSSRGKEPNEYAA